MAQMKKQIKTPEKELSDKEIASLSDTEFKILVIRMLTEMVELSCNMKAETKATQSEINKNIQGANSEGGEARTQINDLDQKEEINIQSEQNEETIQKNEERLRNLRDNFKHSNIWITEVSEGDKKEQEIENLFQKIMKEDIRPRWRCR